MRARANLPTTYDQFVVARTLILQTNIRQCRAGAAPSHWQGRFAHALIERRPRISW